MTSPDASSRRWLRPPRLRTVAEEGERHASWLELFFDLVIVVAIAQLAHLFAQHPGWHGALVAGGLFVAVYLAWQGFSFYADRFDTDDFPYRIATFAQMLALLALALQARDVLEGHYAGFAIAFAILRSILVLLYARAYRHVPAARPLVLRYGSAYAVSVVLWLASVALPDGWWAAAWALALVIDLSQPPLNLRLHRSIPTDPAHVPERLGLFTIIVLGELVVAVGIGAMETDWAPGVAGVAIAGFCIAVCLWWIYFERLAGQELQRASVPIVVYAYAHLPLLGALMFVAGGVSILIQSHGADTATAGAWALCGGVATFLGMLTVSHAQLSAALLPEVVWARGIAVLAALIVPIVARTPIAVTSATLAVLAALVVYEGITCRPPEAAGDRGPARRSVS